MPAAFCLPLSLKIHQGLNQIEEASVTNTNKTTSAERIIQMALEFSVQNETPCTLVLDAFFSVASVFRLANSIWSVKLKAPLVTIIVRAKKNYVGYFPAKKSEEKKPGPGRPRKYGKRVKLMECFDHMEKFSKAVCIVYSKQEEVSIRTLDLLWKGTGETIRFVLAKTSLGPIVLMCDDLTQDPILALELYCSRIRIEIMFDVLKNLIKAFNFRFWSKKMPLHSRRPKKNRNLETPKSEDIEKVKLCWKASEGFVMMGAIAQGFLQLVSLKYKNNVWRKSWAFIRTRSRELPSEKTVKQLITPLITYNLINLAPSSSVTSSQHHIKIR